MASDCLSEALGEAVADSSIVLVTERSSQGKVEAVGTASSNLKPVFGPG